MPILQAPSFETDSLKQFAHEIRQAGDECINGEGNACATVEVRINSSLDFCSRVDATIRAWAMAIFYHELAYDQEAETLLLGLAHEAVGRGKVAIQIGTETETGCYEYTNLPILVQVEQKLWRMLNEWVKPGPAIAPGPRLRSKLAARPA